MRLDYALAAVSGQCNLAYPESQECLAQNEMVNYSVV